MNAQDLNGYTPVHDTRHPRPQRDDSLPGGARGADVTTVPQSGQTTVDLANSPVHRIQLFVDSVVLLERLGARSHHRYVSC